MSESIGVYRVSCTDLDRAASTSSAAPTVTAMHADESPTHERRKEMEAIAVALSLPLLITRGKCYTRAADLRGRG